MIKREKIKVKAERKARKRWLINPRTRVHDEPGYKRGRRKEQNREEIEKELKEKDTCKPIK